MQIWLQNLLKNMSIKTNKILISFVGNRGSGKTTIADFLCKQLDDSGHICLRQHRGLNRRPFLRGLLTAMYLWRFFDIQMIIYFGFRGRKKRIWPSLYRFYLPLAFAHDLHQLVNGHNDVLVYDSNILRGLISSMASGDTDQEEIKDLYKRKVLSKVDRLVFVIIDTKPDESVARWVDRDNVKLSDTDYSNAVSERIKLMHEADEVIDVLSKLPQVTVVRLDGSVDPETNALEVANIVAN